jgi:hypothetical protein
MARLYQLCLAAAKDKKRRVAKGTTLADEEAAYQKGSGSNRDSTALARQTGGPLDKKPKKRRMIDRMLNYNDVYRPPDKIYNRC